MDRIAALKRFKARLKEGKLLAGLCCSTTHPAIIEIGGKLGADFVIIDAEHFSLDRSTLENLIRAAEVHDLVSIVKLKKVDEIEIRDALDLGALGVMAPHIKSPDDVKRLLDYTYFPPRGHRGVCGAARVNAFSGGDVRELVKLTNEEILAIPIIEEGAAVECIDEILAVDDRIDIYDIGPVDMALSMGLPLDRSIENPSPELQKALDKVLSSIKQRGKHIMYPTRYPNQNAQGREIGDWMRQRGVSLVYGFDTHSLVRGARDLLALRGT